MPLIRQDIAQGHDAALALLRRPETEVSDAARVLLRRPDTYASGRFPSHRPDVWIAFDREVRRLASRPYEPLRSNRLEARLCDPDGRIRVRARRVAQPAAPARPDPVRRLGPGGT